MSVERVWSSRGAGVGVGLSVLYDIYVLGPAMDNEIRTEERRREIEAESDTDIVDTFDEWAISLWILANFVGTKVMCGAAGYFVGRSIGRWRDSQYPL